MTKPLLIVTGDSYQSNDPKYPGLHWSEKLHDDFEVVNLAVAGASNTCIADQVLFAFENYDPTYFFVGFTTAGRVEYNFNENTQKQKPTHKWHTNCEIRIKTDKQWKLDADMYELLDFNAWMLRESLLVAQVLDIIKNNKVKYTWAPCGFQFDFDLSGFKSKTYSPELHKRRWNTILQEDYLSKQVELCQHTYWSQNYSQDKETILSLPMFHVDNEKFQIDFAAQVKNILLSD